MHRIIYISVIIILFFTSCKRTDEVNAARPGCEQSIPRNIAEFEGGKVLSIYIGASKDKSSGNLISTYTSEFVPFDTISTGLSGSSLYSYFKPKRNSATATYSWETVGFEKNIKDSLYKVRLEPNANPKIKYGNFIISCKATDKIKLCNGRDTIITHTFAKNVVIVSRYYFNENMIGKFRYQYKEAGENTFRPDWDTINIICPCNDVYDSTDINFGALLGKYYDRTISNKSFSNYNYVIIPNTFASYSAGYLKVVRDSLFGIAYFIKPEQSYPITTDKYTRYEYKGSRLK